MVVVVCDPTQRAGATPGTAGEGHGEDGAAVDAARRGEGDLADGVPHGGAEVDDVGARDVGAGVHRVEREPRRDDAVRLVEQPRRAPHVVFGAHEFGLELVARLGLVGEPLHELLEQRRGVRVLVAQLVGELLDDFALDRELLAHVVARAPFLAAFLDLRRGARERHRRGDEDEDRDEGERRETRQRDAVRLLVHVVQRLVQVVRGGPVVGHDVQRGRRVHEEQRGALEHLFQRRVERVELVLRRVADARVVSLEPPVLALQLVERASNRGGVRGELQQRRGLRG
mmetsp:Transcript_5297/g.21858  ORF Transcript_5297/g.21858 Transcript_5297/m.21858 type:complete len:285 (+) Transcript_5297:435-1289(+)